MRALLYSMGVNSLEDHIGMIDVIDKLIRENEDLKGRIEMLYAGYFFVACVFIITWTVAK